MLNILQVILEIFSRVASAAVLCRCVSVCKQWRGQIATSSIVWRSLLLRELNITRIDDKNRWLNFDTNTKYDLALFTLPWRSIYMEM